MRCTVTITACLAFTGSALAGGSAVTFDNGPEGWAVSNYDVITPEGGNPGAHIAYLNPETFGITIGTETNTDFIGDFTQMGPFELSVDINVNSIAFFGSEVSREIVLDLRDHDNEHTDYPWASVWRSGGLLTSENEGYVTYSWTVDNVDSEALPEGWNGSGAEDPDTIEPILPPGETYTGLLDGVDEVAFTTFVPGFFYGFTYFDIQVDNITITPIDTPTCDQDVSGDGTIDSTDLNVVLGNFGIGGADPEDGDTNGDGEVDSDDLNAVLGSFGEDC